VGQNEYHDPVNGYFRVLCHSDWTCTDALDLQIQVADERSRKTYEINEPIGVGTIIRRRNKRSGTPVEGTMEVVCPNQSGPLVANERR
jgi:hypothetical protein